MFSLVQEDEDLDGLEKELDPFSGKKKSRRVSEKTKQRLSVSEEERKKYAAIQCLAQVTDEVRALFLSRLHNNQ